MNIHLHSEERIRIQGSNEYDLFVDIAKLGDISAGISFLFTDLFYHEFRLKNGMIKIFSFPSKEYTQDFDFGYYDNAEILHVLNRK